MSSPLLVPVDVDVRLVTDDRPFMGPSHRFDLLPHGETAGAYLSSDVVRPAFESPRPLAGGAHVHWLPPGAVGRLDEQGRLRFPEAPNTWLVLRWVVRGGQIVGTKSCIVESDALRAFDPNEQSVSVPTPEDAKMPFKGLGRVCPLAEYVASPDRAPWLTAVGYTGPDFAAMLPNCRGVFGMHDDLKDLGGRLAPDDRLSYCVIGWGGAELGKSNPAAALAMRGWRFDGELDDVDGLLYHGSVRVLSPGGPSVDASDLRAAIGSSPAEALSALIAHLANDRALEGQLNLLQLDLLADTASPDHASLAQSLHRAGFRAETAERTFGLRSRVTHPKLPRPLSPAIQAAVTALVDAQRLFERERARLLAERWQLFADGARLLHLRHDGGETGEAFTWLREHQGEVEEHLEHVRGVLERSGMRAPDDARVRQLLANTDYELVELSEPRHWSPEEPHILLMGALARPSTRFEAHASEQDGLPCRLAAQVVRRARLDEHDGHPEAQIDVAGLAGLPHHRVIQSLVEEAMLLDREDPRGDEALEGTRPAERARKVGGDSWSPVALHWEVQLFPLLKATGNHPAGWVEAAFKLGSPELEYRGDGPQTESNDYQGITLLSSTARADLGQKLDMLIARTRNPRLKEQLASVRRTFGALPVLSQSLEGFHDALLMKRHALQMDIKDPFDARGARDPYAKIKAVVADANTHTAVPNSWFNPIRAGVVRLQRLRIVSDFGECVDLRYGDAGSRVVVGASLKVPAADPPPANRFFLPPRLPQPARLDLRWQPAKDGPLCGWLLVNELDRSLMIHEAGGNLLGVLALGVNEVLWRNGPRSERPEDTLEDVLKRVDPRLGKVVRAWADHDALRGFLACVAETTTDGGRHDPLFGGRPLAVARLRAQLQVRDAVALDQSWEAMRKAVEAGHLPGDTGYRRRPRAGFDAVEFPLRIGEIDHTADGLVGYFAGDDHATFWSQATTSTSGRVRNPDRVGHPLRCSLADHGQEATLIFDPQARVHVAIGILPVKAVDLPPSLHEAAQARLRHALLVAPLLTNGPRVEEPQTLLVPHATTPQVAWAWIERHGAGWREILQAQLLAPAEAETQSQLPWVAREGWLELERKG